MPAFGPRPSPSTALSRRASLPLAAKPKEKDVDWDAKTKQMTAERIMDACLEAMADGDEGRLEACLLELEDEGERAGVIDSLQQTPQVKDDKFWQGKLQEIAAERVLDNCMAAVVRSRRLVPRPRAPRNPHEPPRDALFLFPSRRDAFGARLLARLPSFFADLVPTQPPAQMSGDVDEIEACMLDANNDTLLGVDVTTAEDGTKTFRF